MAVPFINNSLVLARFVWKLEGHHYYVTRHYRVFATVGSNDLDKVATQLANRHASKIASLMAGSYTQVGTFVHSVWPAFSSGTGIGGYNPDPTPWSPNTLPPQVSLLVRLKPTAPSPRKYARIYIPLMPVEENGGNGEPLPGFVTAAKAMLGTLVVPFSFSTPPGQHFVTPVVWTRPGNNWTQLTQLSVASLWATQRRRARTETPTPGPFRSLE